MIRKQFKFDKQDRLAPVQTLPASAVKARKPIKAGYFKRTHKDGWTIEGYVHFEENTRYAWVATFHATHSTLGRVWGDFNAVVFADVQAGLADFYAKHPPFVWDQGDL